MNWKLKIRLVQDWRNGKKWISVWCTGLGTALVGAWMMIPADLKQSIPPKYLIIISGILCVTGFIGRFIEQSGQQPASQQPSGQQPPSTMPNASSAPPNAPSTTPNAPSVTPNAPSMTPNAPSATPNAPSMTQNAPNSNPGNKEQLTQ